MKENKARVVFADGNFWGRTMSAISSSTGESCSCNPQNIYMLNLTYMNFGHGYYFFFFDFLSSSSSSFFF